MSLKAKLEAVIYAAEEPVTLAQLAGLFAQEALEQKTPPDTSAAEPDAEAEPLPLLNEALVSPEPGVVPGQAGEAALSNAPEPPPEPASESEPTAPAGSDTPPSEPTPEAAEAEAKRLARQRDRDVKAILRQLLDELISTYASDDRGIEIKEIAGGYRMATKPECHDAARMFVKSLKPALKLSLPALETLAVIAYKQPVTAPEVNEIRGVDSGGVFASLLTRKLIATAGRKQVIGRPILYKTTREFLLRFGLKDLSELPSMEEFEKMAQLEFDEADMTGSGDVAAGQSADGLPEVDELPDTPDEDFPGYEQLQEREAETGPQTAETADSEPVPAEVDPEGPEQAAGGPADEAASTPAEAAPAAPSTPEQAETEMDSHD